MTGTIDSDPDDDGYSEKIISIRTCLKLCQKHAGAGYREHYHKAEFKIVSLMPRKFSGSKIAFFLVNLNISFLNNTDRNFRYFFF